MAGFIQRGLKTILQKSPDDVVILSALRTPITRAYKGGLKDAYDHELLYHVLRATLASTPALNPSHITDITTGTVLSELGGSKAGRMAALAAGLPHTTAFATVNRACASSLTALSIAAAHIATGQSDVAIAAGMESMSRNYGTRAVPQGVWPPLRDDGTNGARDCLLGMGATAENVAARHGVSRAAQDALAARSQARAAAARAAGRFDAEIVPVPVPAAEGADTLVARDDGIRSTTPAKLAALKPAFSPTGSVTAGNSSQVSDGASAVLLARRSAAARLGLEGRVLAKFAGSVVVGCAPDEMGVGPARAVPALLGRAGIAREDVGLWELNEAFAAQAVHCERALGIDADRVNVNGGAVALGHPLGATGARLAVSLVHEMRRRGGGVGCVTLCVGTGMGQATLLVGE